MTNSTNRTRAMTESSRDRAMDILSDRFGGCDSHFERYADAKHGVELFTVSFVCWNPLDAAKPRSYRYVGTEYSVGSIDEARRYADDRTLLSYEEAHNMLARLGLEG